ncbi:MAG: LysR family transcriptional regulator [Alphaproteobacteria bacterium]|nr:LysR family transcriptional regulator [Alphaproteobacteria bacterium]
MRRLADLPPLMSLRAFEAAARLLSFRRAAAELAISQSAVSHHVAQVESHLGARLFVRKARSIELTQAARQFLPEIQSAFAAITAASARLRKKANRERLRVSLLPSFAANFLVAHLQGFREQAPAIDVDLDPTLDIADVAASAADLAIRYGGGNYPDVNSRCLGAERLVVVASPSLFASSKPIRNPEDVLRHPLLADMRVSGWTAWSKAVGVGIERADIRQLTDYNIVLQAAADGQGLAIGRMLLVEPHIRAGRLAVALPHTVVSPQTCYWLVSARNRRFTRAMTTFADWLGRTLRAAGLRDGPPGAARRIDSVARRTRAVGKR